MTTQTIKTLVLTMGEALFSPPGDFLRFHSVYCRCGYTELNFYESGRAETVFYYFDPMEIPDGLPSCFETRELDYDFVKSRVAPYYLEKLFPQ